MLARYRAAAAGSGSLMGNGGGSGSRLGKKKVQKNPVAVSCLGPFALSVTSTNTKVPRCVPVSRPRPGAGKITMNSSVIEARMRGDTNCLVCKISTQVPGCYVVYLGTQVLV